MDTLARRGVAAAVALGLGFTLSACGADRNPCNGHGDSWASCPAQPRPGPSSPG